MRPFVLPSGSSRRGSSAGSRAVTLIELLIVVAILAILSATLLAVITAPPQEQIFADVDNAFESGSTTFFGALVTDAHAARTLDQRTSPAAIAFPAVADGGKTVLYFVDPDRHLRRAVVSDKEAQAFLKGEIGESEAWRQRGAAILSDVESFEAERTDHGKDSSRAVAGAERWRIEVRAVHRQLGHEQVLDRHIDLLVGLTAGKGGGE